MNQIDQDDQDDQDDQEGQAYSADGLSDQQSNSMSLAEVDRQIEALQRLRARMHSAQQPANNPGESSNKTLATDQTSLPDSQGSIVVIGGRGQLGGLFVRMFQQSGYAVSIIEAEDWPGAKEKLNSAALVLVAVPIQVTESVIKQLSGLPTECVLVDVTSIKQIPLNAMLQTHAGSVLGLHPMFGPDIDSFHGQTIVVCDGRAPQRYSWLLRQLEDWGANLRTVSAAEHDQAMAIVQVLRHFSTVVYGAHLTEEAINIEQILGLSSPIYRLELAMVGRLFAQDPDLYTEIIFANPANIAMMKRYIAQYDKLLSLVEANDKAAFKAVFAETAEWFGPFAEQLFTESSQLLAARQAAMLELEQEQEFKRRSELIE